MLTVANVLAGLAAGTFTVPVVSYILNRAWIQKYVTTKNAKRWTAIGLSFALGIGAFFLMSQLGIRPAPTSTMAWLDALWPVCTAAFTASQAVLSLTKTDAVRKILPGAKKPVEPETEVKTEPDG